MSTTRIVFWIAAVWIAGFVAGNRWGHRAADRWWEERKDTESDLAIVEDQPTLKHFSFRGDCKVVVVIPQDNAKVTDNTFYYKKGVPCVAKPEAEDFGGADSSNDFFDALGKTIPKTKL